MRLSLIYLILIIFVISFLSSVATSEKPVEESLDLDFPQQYEDYGC